MGIDAEMFVKVPREVSDDEILDASRRLVDCFGADKFWLRHDEGRHALSRVNEMHQDSANKEEATIRPAPGETWIRVHMWTRFYGPGYERGDLALIMGVTSFLEITFRDSVVHYGGDSSGVLLDVFDTQRQKEYWDHFVRFGHSPYGQYFDKEKDGPECGLCKVNMIRNGWGPQFACWYCASCGAKRETQDGGKTLFDPKQRRVELKRALFEKARALTNSQNAEAAALAKSFIEVEMMHD